MLDEWFCRIAGREIGPLSSEQLKTMAANGQILPNDRVRQGATANWTPADDVEGLFPARAELPPPGVKPPDVHALPPPRAQSLPRARPIAEPCDEPLSAPSLEISDDTAPVSVVAEPARSAAPKRGGELTAMLIRARHKRRQQMLVTGSMVVAVTGVVIVYLIWAAGSFEKLSSEIKEGGGFNVLAEKVENATITNSNELRGDGIPSPSKEKHAGSRADAAAARNVSEQPLQKPADQRERGEKEGENKWVDASMLPAVFDKIRVNVLSVAWEGPETGKREGYRLAVTLEVENTGVALPVMFAGWSPDATARGVILKDEWRKTYEAKPADPETTVANLLPIKINPGKSAKDVLLFEAPDAKVKYLRLQLSASAFGKDGIAYLQIPAAMIGGNPPVPAPPPKPAKKAAPAKAAPRKPEEGPTGIPAIDFGIRPDDAPPQ
jgi:hypothetical protein